MVEVKRRLAAILAADVVGYSRLMAADERSTLDMLNAAREVFRTSITERAGRVVDTAGDSVMAVFESVVEAVECASEIQTELRARLQMVSEDRRMEFRIGVNLGDIIEQDDGTIYGDGVNVAARLEALAEPGGVCLSESAHMQVEGKSVLRFEDIGEHVVKNMARPVRAYQMTFARPSSERVAKPEISLPPASSSGPAIAVLPFANLSPDPEQAYFADGIVEEIITELSRFGDLRVLGRVSTTQYKNAAVDVRKIGRDLAVDYVLEGSVRRGGDRLRVTAQLLDAKGGGHLWAETYQRTLTASDIFDIQDDISKHVVTEVGGAFGAVSRARMTRLDRARTDDLAAYDSMLLYHRWMSTFDHTSYWAAHKALENAVKIDPSYADAWAGLGSVYSCEVTMFYALKTDSLDRALTAAQRAVRLAPDHVIGYRALAHARLQRREDTAFFDAADRALNVNENDRHSMAVIAGYLCFAGDWDRGLQLLDAATSHWSWTASLPQYVFFMDHYRKGKFDQALAIAGDSVGLSPEFELLFLIAAFGELGRLDEAHSAIEQLHDLCPNISEYLGLFRHRQLDVIVNGLRMAGLNVPEIVAEGNR